MISDARVSVGRLNGVRRRIIYGISLATISLGGLGSCGNGEPGYQGIGPLTDIVFAGSVDGWAGSTEAGVYWLENEAGDANDIRYFYTAPAPDDRDDRTAHVDVITSRMDPEGRAGLLYGFRESPRFYYLIMVSGSGNVEVYERDGGNFRQSFSSSLGTTKKDSARVEIREKGRELTILANGNSVGSIENDQVGRGQIGIAAFGTGRFGFTNYAQTPSPVNAPAQGSGPARSAPANPAARIDRSGYIDYVDPEMGMVQHSAPFPKGWQYDTNPNDQLLLTGPDGTRCFQTGSGQFLYSEDPFVRESAQMGGAQVAPFMPLDRYLNQQFAPYMAQRGYSLVNQFPIPALIDFMDLFAAGMPQGLSRRQFDALGAEWTHSDGSRAYTQLTQTLLTPQANQPQGYISWNVSALELYANPDRYEEHKDALIHGAIHTEINPQWQIAKNQQLLAQIRASRQYADEQMRQSQIQHIGRMNAILARAETSSSVARINSDILDISHAGYLKRSDMVSAGQARTINMIGEQSVIANPGTGERYKVDAGYKNYWVNAEGKYFHTDNSLYDPRTDNQISNQQWERFEVVP